jgi:hypothetical protein
MAGFARAGEHHGQWQETVLICLLDAAAGRKLAGDGGLIA